MPLILLAEEETSTIDHVRSALASQGWLVKTVGTRDQALRAASEFAPQLVLVNRRLAGAEDLIRTFSRQSGGPGVVLLSTDNGHSETDSGEARGVEAILAIPLDTGSLIETIRQGLATSKDKPPTPPVADTAKVFTSAEIFGDLLDDFVDEDAPSEPSEAASGEGIVETPADKDYEPVAAAPQQVEEELEIVNAPAPEIEEEPQFIAAATPEIEEEVAAADKGSSSSLAGLEDLEEVVREGVEAWADSVRPEDEAETEEEDYAALAGAMAAPEARASETEIEESEESFDSKLEDTLSGVLAEALSRAEDPPTTAEVEDQAASSVDALLSQALGGLNLGGTLSAKTVDSETENLVADDLKALTAAIDLETMSRVGESRITEPEKKPAEELPEKEDSIEFQLETEPESTAGATEAQYDEDIESTPSATEAAPPAAIAGEATEFGEYTLEKRIGVGGMASVWKARRKGVEGFEKRVAIKKILPQAAENEEFVEMFIDEAKLAAQLNHNNITHIYDLGKIDNDYFIAMEYVEGKNLRQILDQIRKEDEQVPVGVALFVASQIADALDYAHHSKDFNDAELGLVHRDVSPQNVLISFEGDVKLCDFGIAKAVSKISTTQMGALKGKLQYMSPEQAWGKSIDSRSDIFSLGTLLYEMLAGERLFSGDSELAILEAVREAEVGARIIQSTTIPANVKGILLKALAKDPEDRFENAAELQHGLAELINAESPTPSAKGLSVFVRELLGLKIDVAEVQEIESPVLEVNPDSDLAWEPPTEDTEDSETEEGDKAAWLRRLLTRLLPVILVVAVGGGIIAALMLRESGLAFMEDPQVPAFSTLSSTATDTIEGEVTATPQGQPPPESAATTEPTSAPPTQQKDPEPKQTPKTEEKAPQPAARQPAAREVAREQPAVADPELERRVEEELQKVQALMDGTADTDDPESSEEDSVAASFSLDSLWRAVTPGSNTETGESADQPLQEAAVDSPQNPVTRVGALVQPGPGVIEPRVVEFQQPEYTEEARLAGVAGSVQVSVLVDENGSAAEVRLVAGLPQQVGLEEAVIESAKSAVFRPATKDGVPVKMWYQITVLFEP